jgi:hypothetical protein
MGKGSSMRSLSLPSLFALASLIGAVQPNAPGAFAQTSAPKAVAETFLNGLDAGDTGALYERWLAPRAKESVSKEYFAQSINVFRIQTGGAVQSRLFVGGTPLSQLQNGMTGTFY